MPNPRPQLPNAVLPSIAFEGGLGVAALLVGNWLARPPGRLFHWDGHEADLLWGVCTALPPFVLLLLWLRFPVGPLPQLRRMIGWLFGACSTLELGLIALAAGLGEELLFRGLVQPIAIDKLGVMPGLVAASLLFGLAHPLSRLYIVLTAAVGVYLGWLLLFFDNLLVPILAHAVYDFLALMVLLHGQRAPATAAEADRGDK